MVKKTTSKRYVVALGEIMLRLKSIDRERLFQSPNLEATFGGAEGNFLTSLSNYNIPTRLITAFPNNLIGVSAIQILKGLGVDTSQIILSNGRMGIYYLEQGSGPRPSNVIYDRNHSSISQALVNQFSWDSVFLNAKWFHFTGITPALSQSAADLCEHAVKQAKNLGLTISCDLNYRSQLWTKGGHAPGETGCVTGYSSLTHGRNGRG